jgi:MFS family permease
MSLQLDDARDAPTSALSRERQSRILVPLLLGPLIYVFMQSLVIPAIGAVAASIHASVLDTTWALTAYLVSGAVSTPLAGRLGDLFGNRRVLVWVLWITAAGGLISAMSATLVPLVIGRILAGTSTATMPLGYGIIRESLPRERLAPAIGLIAVSIAVGTGIGNVIAGVVIDGLGVPWLFWLPLIVTIPTCVMAQLWIPDSPRRDGAAVHWPGAVAMSVSLLCLLIAISESTRWGWGSARTVGLLAFGLAALAVWVRLELAADQPLIDMRLMALPGVSWTNFVSFLFGFAMFGAWVVIPQYVETPPSVGYGFGASITEAGLFLLPATVTMSFGGPLASRLERRFGPKLILIVGGVIGVAGYALLCLFHTDRAAIYAAFVLLGIGMGVGYSVLPHLIVLAVPHEHTGAATGINVIARNIGGALGIQIGATVIAAHVPAGAVFPTEAGYVAALWLFLAGGIGATVGSACIPTRRHRALVASGLSSCGSP